MKVKFLISDETRKYFDNKNGYRMDGWKVSQLKQIYCASMHIGLTGFK